MNFSGVNFIQDYTEMLHCKFTQYICTGHTGVGHSLYVYVTGPMKIDHLSTKNRRFLACLLYHNLLTIYTIATKSSSLLQILLGFLLQLTEMGWCI